MVYLAYDGRPIESRMIYRTAPFSVTLNHPYTPGFKVTPFFIRDTNSFNGRL